MTAPKLTAAVEAYLADLRRMMPYWTFFEGRKPWPRGSETPMHPRKGVV